MKTMLLFLLFSLPLLANDSATPKDQKVTLKSKKVVQKSLVIPKRNPTTKGTSCTDPSGEWKPGTPEYERCAIPATEADAK